METLMIIATSICTGLIIGIAGTIWVVAGLEVKKRIAREED